jgi:hypothetical protein
MVTYGDVWGVKVLGELLALRFDRAVMAMESEGICALRGGAGTRARAREREAHSSPARSYSYQH